MMEVSSSMVTKSLLIQSLTGMTNLLLQSHGQGSVKLNSPEPKLCNLTA